MPLGNQTSQFFANVYLNPLDHFVRRLFPRRVRLVRGNVVRYLRRLRYLRREFAAGRIGWEEVRPAIAAWLGHARHGDTWRLRSQIFRQNGFVARRMRAAGTSPEPRRVLEQQFEERPRVES